VRRKPPGTTLFVIDDGTRTVHPDRKPQEYSPGGKPSCCDAPDYHVTLEGGESGIRCSNCDKFRPYGVNLDDWSKVMDVTKLKELLGGAE
jgi:hypothetical protein